MTISDRVVVTKGRSRGFDYMRIGLSVGVVAFHTATEDALWRGAARPLIFVILPCFFALSGFLVAGSLERVNNLPVFLTLRALRIFPALVCEVVISAIMIGPALTVLPLAEYFSDPKFHAYFLNILGDVHFFLPGVFLHNPVTGVNQQLWTIPFELKCYLLIPVLSALTVTRRPRLFGVFAIVLNVLAFYKNWTDGLIHPGFVAPGTMMVTAFIWGVYLYLNRTRIPYNGWLCCVLALVSWFVILWWPEATYLTILPIAYITVYLGLTNPPATILIATGDFSYGVYLYGFPIQQVMASLLPGGRIWYVNFVASLLVAGLAAWLSWTQLESRVLARKGIVTRWVDGASRAVAARWSAGRIAAAKPQDRIVK